MKTGNVIELLQRFLANETTTFHYDEDTEIPTVLITNPLFGAHRFEISQNDMDQAMLHITEIVREMESAIQKGYLLDKPKEDGTDLDGIAKGFLEAGDQVKS